MNRDQQLKILKSKKASKEQLREALSACLGVAYEQATKEKEVSLFTQCRDIFLEAYKKHTGFDYSFGAKDGKALSCLIDKVCHLFIPKPHITYSEVLDTFRMLLDKLPDWYKQNAFSLPRINGNFNEIIASIKKNGNGKQQVTSDYGDRVAERIRARQSKP